jgi:hypothetical protein
VVGGVHLPGDGQCDPANIAMALAKGARMHGAKVIEGVRVTRVLSDGARVTGVEWGGSTAPRAPLPPSTSSTAAACGGGSWPRSRGWRCPSTPPSTSTW